MEESEFNEVSITVNGEVVAKSAGPSPSLEMIESLVDELRRRAGLGETRIAQKKGGKADGTTRD